jgi:hypothetical protein
MDSSHVGDQIGNASFMEFKEPQVETVLSTARRSDFHGGFQTGISPLPLHAEGDASRKSGFPSKKMSDPVRLGALPDGAQSLQTAKTAKN